MDKEGRALYCAKRRYSPEGIGAKCVYIRGERDGAMVITFEMNRQMKDLNCSGGNWLTKRRLLIICQIKKKLRKMSVINMCN
jgi:hypothetical protein